jgi:zinc/manganese transport system substrate-binding protein
MSRFRLPVIAAAALALSACGSAGSDGAAGGTEAADAEAVTVVATTTMLGDVAARVTRCGGGSAATLMPIGADPHDFAPSSEQVAAMVSADLVVANGLGLEQGLTDALEAAVTDGAVVLEVAPLVDPIEFSAGADHEDEHDHADEDHADEDDHAHGDLDPHFWHDVSRMALAAELMGAELADVTGDDQFVDCGMQVASELEATDDAVRETVAALDPADRVLVTDHAALGYFAEAYGFEVVGVVIPGGATLAEPSSQELADLAAVIEAEDVPAIFSNTAAPSDLTDAVAAEVGSDVAVVELYVGSLGPEGSGAETYAEMVQTNAERIVDALGRDA